MIVYDNNVKIKDQKRQFMVTERNTKSNTKCNTFRYYKKSRKKDKNIF